MISNKVSKGGIANRDLIRFHLLTSVNLSERKKLKTFLIGLARKERKTIASLDFIFCDDAYLLNINQQFLQHDDLTDIITFDLSENNQPLRGEIYISADRVKENASLFKTSLKEELHRVIFHGVLHLCGYKDKEPHDKNLMTQKENEYLSLYF